MLDITFIVGLFIAIRSLRVGCSLGTIEDKFEFISSMFMRKMQFQYLRDQIQGSLGISDRET
jgi:hypothetical protein